MADERAHQLLNVELLVMQQKFKSGKLRAFGNAHSRHKLLGEVSKIREMQMDIFKQHMNMELSWEDEQANEDFESENFCSQFQNSFNVREKEVQDITTKLHELSRKITVLNEHLSVDDVDFNDTRDTESSAHDERDPTINSDSSPNNRGK